MALPMAVFRSLEAEMVLSVPAACGGWRGADGRVWCLSIPTVTSTETSKVWTFGVDLCWSEILAKWG